MLMDTYCGIKGYIERYPTTQGHKEYINNNHNKIWDELKDSKMFVKVNDSLYAYKWKYAESIKAINDLNKRLGYVVAGLVNDNKGGKRLVAINAIGISEDFEFSPILIQEGNQYFKEGEVYPTLEDAENQPKEENDIEDNPVDIDEKGVGVIIRNSEENSVLLQESSLPLLITETADMFKFNKKCF